MQLPGFFQEGQQSAHLRAAVELGPGIGLSMRAHAFARLGRQGCHAFDGGRQCGTIARRADHAGLRALDSHTLQITVDKPRPRLVYVLADASVLGVSSSVGRPKAVRSATACHTCSAR